MGILANAKHERFAQALAKGETADAAYVIAGYARNDGNARRLKGNEAVERRVSEILAAGAARAEITVERVLTELGRIGFADMRKLLRWTGNLPQMNLDEAEASGEVEISTANFIQLFDSNELDDDIVAAIAEISQTKDGALKVKLHDKKAALVAIGNHLGMFTTKVEHSGAVDLNHKVQADADAFTRSIAGIAARAGAGSGDSETQH